MNSVLYYPTIEFVNPNWLWTASILWDRIYRIVPEDYVPQDCNNIRELIESGEFIKSINPKPYVQNSLDMFYNFLDDKKKAWACALESAKYHNDKYIKMHKDKVDVKLWSKLLAKGRSDNDWLDVPSEIATLYMLYLSENIANSNSLVLATDSTEAWCGENFFEFEGQIDTHPEENDKTYLCALTVSNIIPSNILNLQPRELVKFRNQSKDERISFFNSIDELSNELNKCSDKQVIADIISEHINNIKRSKKDYNHRCRDIAAQNFFGIKTSVIPMALQIVDSFTSLSDDIKAKLELLGIGIGMIGYCFNTSQAILNERQKHGCNYLLELQKQVPNFLVSHYKYDDANTHGDYHLLLNHEMEHFIYD